MPQSAGPFTSFITLWLEDHLQQPLLCTGNADRHVSAARGCGPPGPGQEEDLISHKVLSAYST